MRVAGPPHGRQIAALMRPTRGPARLALLVLALALVAPAPARGQDGDDDNGGLIGLTLPLGARVVGQGRAIVADRGELQGIPYNPALQRAIPRGALTYSRYEAVEETGLSGNYLAGAYAGPWGSIGAHLVYQDLGEIPITDASPDPIGQIDLSDWVFGVTYANVWREWLDYGATIKWASSNLGVAEASGVAFDLGVVFTPRTDLPLSLAVSLRNVGPDLEFEDGGQTAPGGPPAAGADRQESLPGRVRLGIALGPDRFLGLSERYRVRLLFDIESDLDRLSTSSQHFGGSLTFQDLIVLRGGFLLADNPFVDEGDGDRQVGGAFGIGIHLQGFEVDIAREVSVSELGDETHFGVGWRF